MEEIIVHESAHIEENVVMGKGCKIWHNSQIRKNAVLGENVIVGKSSFVDKSVKIGNNVKIQNMVSIYQGVTLDDNVFVGPHVVFTNDLYPRTIGNWKIVETIVKFGASIGANSTIICGITIGKFALIAAGAVVTKNVPDNALMMGVPAKLVGYVCECARKILDSNLKLGNYNVNCLHCNKATTIIIE